MKSERLVKTFATFRIAGDTLNPLEVTQLLRVQPTHAHRKDEKYSTGRSEIVGKTGVWLFSTDQISLSDNLYEHIGLIFTVLGLIRSRAGIGEASEEERANAIAHILRLERLLKQNSLTATMTFFWHGPHNVPYPKVPEAFIGLFQLIPIALEMDFDRDEEVPPRRAKVA